MELVLDIVLDAAKDTLVLAPFLFVTYLAIALVELFWSERLDGAVRRAGRLGPVIGALAGLVPQCGFSAMGATLFAGRAITAGTLVAVFLSTSDEMLPLLIAARPPAGLVVRILLIKLLVALVAGFVLDALAQLWRRAHPGVPAPSAGTGATGVALQGESGAAGSAGEAAMELRADAFGGCACGCCGPVPLTRGQAARMLALDAVRRTLEVLAFVFAVSLVLGAVLEGVGEEALAGLLGGNAVAATFLSGLVGLIPNCAASVVITQLYLEGSLAFGPMMAGSLMAAGAGYLVLFRANARPAQNAAIIAALYAVSVVVGLALGSA